jgi:hypothetical protein
MDELEARIEALERAVTEGDHDLSELATEGETRDRLAAVETELGDLADRVAELEAATQALRGYVGNVRAVNRDVEQRADAALAKAESLESAIVDGDPTGDRAERDCRAPTPEQAGGATPPGANGHPPEQAGGATPPGANGHPQESAGGATPPGANGHPQESDTPADRETRPDGTNGTADTSTASGSPPAAHGNTGESTGHERCATCGRPTDRTAGDAGNGSGVSAGGTGTGGSDDPLDGVFEADGRGNGDGGRFDRIRKML